MESTESEPQELELASNSHFVLPLAMDCLGIIIVEGQHPKLQFKLTGNILVEIPLSKNAAGNAEELIKPLISSQPETTTVTAR